MDMPEITPMKIMGMLGGKMGPITAELALMAAENVSSYPRLRMTGCKTADTELASATADPDTPAMMTLTIMET